MKKITYIFVDMMCVITSIIIAVLLRFDFQFPAIYHKIVLDFLPIAIVLTIVTSLFLGVYKTYAKYFGFSDLINQMLVSSVIFGVTMYIKYAEILQMSGSIVVMYCFAYVIVSSTVRSLPRFERYLIRKSGDKIKRVIIIGAGNAGASVIKKMIDTNDLNPVCILDDDKKKHKSTIFGVKVAGEIAEAKLYAEKYGATQFFIAIPSVKDDELKKIINKLLKTGLPVKILQDAVDVLEYNQGNEKALKDVSIEDLLFRESVQTDNEISRSLIENKVVLVTGGAGSIGSELCRQILENNAKHLVIFDINENGMFELNEELKTQYLSRFTMCIGSVRDKKRLSNVFEKYSPQIVFHAAAHKHVPMMEINPFEAVKNNVLGTRNVILQAKKCESEKFVLISTDKAVNPTNVMGATKRTCELLVKTYSSEQTEMVAVRFGNVLGSNGSVIPLFKKQIASGGPVTVTDKEMTRYFMTIKEAVSLVLSAGTLANKSELFVLDMGKPVKIYELAQMLIKLSGRVPFDEIDIKIMGLRDGEKLFEELNLESESVDKTAHEKIFVVKDNGLDKDFILSQIEKIEEIVTVENDEEKLKTLLFETINEVLVNT